MAGVYAHRVGLTTPPDNKFDGDMCSWNVVYSVNALQEVSDYLNSRRAYINANGGLSASPFSDTVKYVLHNLTA